MSLVRCGYHHLVEVYLGLALDFDQLGIRESASLRRCGWPEWLYTCLHGAMVIRVKIPNGDGYACHMLTESERGRG